MKIREKVLRHYSGDVPFCQCCGENHMEFLGIDHINGGGSDFRKRNSGGAQIYGWLKKNNYPPGFRVLCHNCNMSIGFYGNCPHQRQDDVIVSGPGSELCSGCGAHLANWRETFGDEPCCEDEKRKRDWDKTVVREDDGEQC